MFVDLHRTADLSQQQRRTLEKQYLGCFVCKKTDPLSK